MAELLKDEKQQVPELTPTTIATFSALQSNHGLASPMQESLTQVQMAANKILVSKGNDMQLIDLSAKDDCQFEVRRADTLCVKSAKQTTNQQHYQTVDTRLSVDGRTVTSLKEADNGLQMVEVWDSGKGSVCRVQLQSGESVTAFHQERRGNENFLFLCVKKVGSVNQHVLNCYEIDQDGESVDTWLQVDLANNVNLVAGSIYLGTNALYVNIGYQYLYKLDIIEDMLDNSFDDLTCAQRRLSEFLAFDMGQNNDGLEIVRVQEYVNESDVWRHLGNEKDLLIVAFSDCSIMIFDQLTGDNLKTINVLPAPFSQNLTQADLLDARLIGGQFTVLAMLGAGQLFHGLVILHLDERLQYCISATTAANLTREAFGLVNAGCLTDRGTADIVSNSSSVVQSSGDQSCFTVTNLKVFSDAEALLCEIERDMTVLPQGAEQESLIEQLLETGLFKQLADFILLENNRGTFALTEKGSLVRSIDRRLKEQLDSKINLILQAIKCYSLAGITKTEKAEQDREAILHRIREEQEFVEGIETVYEALLKMQTITALGIQAEGGLDQMSENDIEAIEITKRAINDNLVKRRTILAALDFVARTSFLVYMVKMQADFSLLLRRESSLLYNDLLRQAPVHLRELKEPISTLENVLSLFDAAQSGSYLPHAVLFYHFEAYRRDFAAQEDQFVKGDVDSSFIPRDVQRTVASIYSLDRLLTDQIQEPKQITEEIINVISSHRGLVRSQSLLDQLLKQRLGKQQLHAALFVISDARCLENAHAENQLEEFIESAISVFINLSKPREGFNFLSSVESRVYAESKAYSDGIASLIEHVETLAKDEIMQKFLSLTFTRRQEAEIDRYLLQDSPNLQVVREFWCRRPVQAVGLSMNLDWKDQSNGQMLKVRSEGVNNFMGSQLAQVSSSGIFSQEQKLAAQQVSQLNYDEFQLYRPGKDDHGADQEMNEDDHDALQRQAKEGSPALMKSVVAPFSSLKPKEEPSSLASFFFSSIVPPAAAMESKNIDLFSLAAGSSRSADGQRQGAAAHSVQEEESARLFKGAISIPADRIDQQFYYTNTKVSESQLQQFQELVKDQPRSRPFNASDPSSFAEDKGQQRASWKKFEESVKQYPSPNTEQSPEREGMKYKGAYSGGRRSQQQKINHSEVIARENNTQLLMDDVQLVAPSSTGGKPGQAPASKANSQSLGGGSRGGDDVQNDASQRDGLGFIRHQTTLVKEQEPKAGLGFIEHQPTMRNPEKKKTPLGFISGSSEMEDSEMVESLLESQQDDDLGESGRPSAQKPQQQDNQNQMRKGAGIQTRAMSRKTNKSNQ